MSFIRYGCSLNNSEEPNTPEDEPITLIEESTITDDRTTVDNEDITPQDEPITLTEDEPTVNEDTTSPEALIEEPFDMVGD